MEERHQKACAGRRDGGRCNCRRSYRGQVWDAERKAPEWGPWGPSVAEAVNWRSKALLERAAGSVATTRATLRDEAEAWLAGVRAGTTRDRTGTPYKPSTIRSYERGLARILPALGAHRLSDLRRPDVQAFVDRLGKQGLAPSTVRNTIDPLRAIYRHAVQRERVTVNPTTGLDVPHARVGRQIEVDPDRAAVLLAALPEGERALWATAFYCGLRRGELRALRWTDVDLSAGLIHVRRAWDDREGEIEPKTRAALRRVPIIGPLADALRDHQELTGRGGADLVFGATATRPFEPSTVRSRARRAWVAAGLDPVTLHEARHACASFLIASGVDLKALTTLMGHSSVTMSIDRYGHLLKGGEAAAGDRLEAWLAA